MKGHVNYINELFEIVENIPNLEPDKAVLQARKWIKEFTKAESHEFAVIKIGGESLAPISSDFIRDIGILSNLGLYSPIVYGWGKALTAKLTQEGIETKFHPTTGDRITTAEQHPFLEEIADKFGNRLIEKLADAGINARLVKGVFQAVPTQLQDYTDQHYTGEVTSVNPEDIIRSISEGYVPIVSPLGIHESRGHTLNINGDSAASALTVELGPQKFIYLTEVGKVYDLQEERLPKIVLATDYERLCDNGTLTGGMGKKVATLKQALEGANTKNAKTVAAIASPHNLIPELFTDEGVGTYVQSKSNGD